MTNIPGLVYILCTITSLVCTGMLFRGYKVSGFRLLLWSSLCFAALTVENIMLYLDLVVLVDVEEITLVVWRKIPGLVGVCLLLYGLVWDSK
jgi:hypothetical protein